MNWQDKWIETIDNGVTQRDGNHIGHFATIGDLHS